MSKNRMVNTRFWSDGFVVDHLNALDRYLFLYLLTNERTNLIGIYELSLRTAAFETGIEKEDLAKMLVRLSPKVEYFDGWVYIRQFTSHQQSNPSVDKGIMREFFALPEYVINRVKELGVDSQKLRTAYDMLSTATDSLSQSVTDSPQAAGNLTKLNLTKPNGIDLDKSKSCQSAKQLDRDVQEIFNHYVEQFHKPTTKLSPVRKQKIRTRLKDAGKDMLMQAVTNTANSPHHQGDNDRAWKANIDFIIRSYEQVERLAHMHDKQGTVDVKEALRNVKW